MNKGGAYRKYKVQVIFYKNSLYKNHEAQIRKILRIIEESSKLDSLGLENN